MTEETKIDLVAIMLDIRGEVSALQSRVDGIQAGVNDLRDRKVDRREIRALLPFNWVLKNWKLIVTIAIMASSAGFISIHGGLGQLVRLLGGM